MSTKKTKATELRVSLFCRAPTRLIKIGWLSFQYDGSISFGLTDKTHITPSQERVLGFWNLYNQVSIKYEQPSDPSGLESVTNPHFTFHPPMLFHLTDSSGRSNPNPIELFKGLNDAAMTVEQYGILPWIRAISPSLTNLGNGVPRQDGIVEQQWIANVPSEEISAKIEIDFIKHVDASGIASHAEWHQIWKTCAIRCRIKFSHPQISTLSWFHNY